MSIKAFYEELRKGLKAPAYLLYADNEYMLKEALDAAKRSIPESGRDFLFHVYDKESPVTVEQIIDVLYTMPMTGGRQTVAVNGINSYTEKETDAFSAYIAKPSPDSVLLLLHKGAPSKTRKEALKKAVAIPLDIRASEMPVYLREAASLSGINLSAKAVEYLMAMVGPDAGLLKAEVEKLAMAGKKDIDEADIKEYGRSMGGYGVFDLTAALSTGDAQKVFKIYGAISDTVEPYNLLGVLNWHYGKGKERSAAVKLLNEADIMVKTGREYPMEYLLARLLKLTGPKKKPLRP